MQLKSGIKFVIYLSIITISLITYTFVVSDSKKSITSEPQTEKLEVENKPKNPTPENIQVLGETDTATMASSQKGKDTTETPTFFDSQILYNLINSYRKDHKLNKLFINKLLEDSAQRKIADMINSEYFRHRDKNDNESWYLFQAAGYQYKFAGENLSTGNNTPWQVFEAWQKSEIHNTQLLKPEYLDMGIAVNCEAYRIGRNPSCLVVLHLGSR